ncbi:chaperone required for assembly of F1-ATPase [Novosphingobium sp. PhB165]|uniref:ATP12 family chaperone protein n=1 Tax=Novosphingobium sp. PhB165 TaxID=2485105 RepID=UPI0010536887|nr:ATP12 family protein [Novosphingobium sp. PhB165]TCM19461.1 chaperone required for assembly of F1-ATPase [Novosphingobium sp. PhB165]
MKRFYKEATVSGTEDGWRVLLDGRGIKTAGGRPQVVPTPALAEALAAEWAAQGEEIDPGTFPLRDLADFAVDVVIPDRALAVREILPYAETDTLCYRADPEDALFARQLAVWEPLLAAAEQRHGLRFTRVSGIVHKAQPAETLAQLEATLGAQDAFTLASLKMLSSLAHSLVVALAAIEPGADAEALWKAANLEEDWQVELWGEDWEAAERRAARFAAFTLAMDFVRLARAG